MSDPQRRRELTVLIWQAVSDGARQQRACQVVGLSARTLQRWQDERAAPVDRRTQGRQAPAHQLSQAEREQIVQIANSAQFGHLLTKLTRARCSYTRPPWQKSRKAEPRPYV